MPKVNALSLEWRMVRLGKERMEEKIQLDFILQMQMAAQSASSANLKVTKE